MHEGQLNQHLCLIRLPFSEINAAWQPPANPGHYGLATPRWLPAQHRVLRASNEQCSRWMWSRCVRKAWRAHISPYSQFSCAPSDSSLAHQSPHIEPRWVVMDGQGLRARVIGEKRARKEVGRTQRRRRNLNPLRALPFPSSIYSIRRNIKLYIVLDEILTSFQISSRSRIDVGPWTSAELMCH